MHKQGRETFFPENRSYGRRSCRPLPLARARLVASVLPALRLSPEGGALDLQKAFSGSASRRIEEALASCGDSSGAPFLRNLGRERVPVSFQLEIGFGGGEHLLWQAKRSPDVGFLGVETFLDGVAKVVSGIQSAGLLNIRLYDGNIWDLLPFFPAGSFSRIFVLFPDPWCKSRQKKRRLFSQPFVSEIARILAAGGELRVASDVPDYVDSILRLLHNHPGFLWNARCQSSWNTRPADAIETRYEAKGMEAGRSACYLQFFRLPDAQVPS